jgi:hypothetical protein
MGQHGLVTGADGKRLQSLHEALRLEMEQHVTLFKAALHKMEQLQLGQHHGKHGVAAHDKGDILAEVSHQRLLQVRLH